MNYDRLNNLRMDSFYFGEAADKIKEIIRRLEERNEGSYAHRAQELLLSLIQLSSEVLEVE